MRAVSHTVLFLVLAAVLVASYPVISSLPDAGVTGYVVKEEPAPGAVDWSPFISFAYLLFGVLLAGIVLKTHRQRSYLPLYDMKEIPAYFQQSFAMGRSRDESIQRLTKAGWAPDVVQEIYAGFEKR